jgi:ABC-type multidrug transport system ATPase subunit/ABC-type transport system involved in multi-copper enzyme maturation permease subunit
MNYIQPSSGSANIFGKDIVRDSVEIKRSVGYLAGDFAVYPKMTGRQYIKYLCELQAPVKGYDRELSRLLNAELDKKLGELSRGNRQKIGIIQAFMHQPQVIILDEPTSGLDPLMQEVFYKLVNDAKKRGASIFISSHIMSEVQKICDRAGIIRGGKLVSEENMSQLAKKAAQTFDITFADKVPVSELKKIKGIRIENENDRQVKARTAVFCPGKLRRGQHRRQKLRPGRYVYEVLSKPRGKEMIPTIKWTILQRRLSIFWWSFGIFFFIFVNMIFYPSFKQDADQLQQSFENLPDSAIQFLGGSTDFFSAIGFINSQVFFLTLPLLLGILAISLGSNLIAKEEQDKTIEALLARPISRSKLLLAKVLSGVFILAFVTLVGLITTIVSAKFVDLEVSATIITLTTFVCFLMALSFASVAFVFTAIGRARGASIGIATTIALGGYIISSLAGTVEWLRGVSKLFPFDYYQSEAILRETYNWANILFFVALTVILGLLSWTVFKKRDLI